MPLLGIGDGFTGSFRRFDILLHGNGAFAVFDVVDTFVYIVFPEQSACAVVGVGHGCHTVFPAVVGGAAVFYGVQKVVRGICACGRFRVFIGIGIAGQTSSGKQH